jgi:hypothetical protein
MSAPYRSPVPIEIVRAVRDDIRTQVQLPQPAVARSVTILG